MLTPLARAISSDPALIGAMPYVEWSALFSYRDVRALRAGQTFQVEGLAFSGFPAASLATALNFILSPTWASVTRGVISMVAGSSAFGSVFVS